jgi:predicted NBD/HSP70 family sugar kinase
MRHAKSDQTTIRSLNRRLILNHLRQHGAQSRAHLAEVTGLSPAAVTGVTAGLIGDGWLTERELGSSSGGRPPIMIDIDYASHFAVGIKVMESRLEAVLTDLSTAVLQQKHLALGSHSPEAVVEAANAVTTALLARAGATPERLIGVGIGMPGVIDPRGLCHSSPILAWRDVPIAAMAAQRIGASVWVDNDVNAFAAAERLFGHGKHAQNFLTLTVGRGIGMGLVLNGEVYRGRDGGAGEFGHVLSEPDGLPCECGNRGCLEAYAAEHALVKRHNAARPRGKVADIQALLERAAQGDADVLGLLEDAGRRVGRALSGVLNVFNPELIVVGGEGVRLGTVFFNALREAMHAHAFNGLADDVPVFVDAWGDDAWARGAASLAVQRAFAWAGEH